MRSPGLTATKAPLSQILSNLPIFVLSEKKKKKKFCKYNRIFNKTGFPTVCAGTSPAVKEVGSHRCFPSESLGMCRHVFVCVCVCSCPFPPSSRHWWQLPGLGSTKETQETVCNNSDLSPWNRYQEISEEISPLSI